jgi:alpha-tubulin suppressor-like RCC1 family protein
MLGNGDGSFAAAPSAPINFGGNLDSVAVGDFNNDGRPDIAVVDQNGGTVTILKGDGAGGFATTSPIPVGVTAPASVVVGDFNGDGKLDFAVVGETSNNVAVWLGNGDGTFSQGPVIAVGTSPVAMVAGDFNGDGKQDLAVANDAAGTGATVSVLLGDGAGSFAPASGSPVSVGTNPLSLAVGDFNGDGKQDLAVLTPFAGDTVTVLLGNGNGTFSIAAGPPIRVGAFPQAILSADFNRDGKPDLVVTNANSNSISVLLNTSQSAVSVSPSPVLFVPGAVGWTSPSQTVTLTNKGAWNLTVSGVSIVGTDADQFKLSGDSCSGTVVRAGASCSVGVVFGPTRSGPANASLRVTSNAPGGMLTVSVSGAGLPSGTSGLRFANPANPLFAAGLNSNGQLGVGGASSSSVPLAVRSGSFVAAAAGAAFSLGLSPDGTVWSWGSNGAGQLGTGSGVDAETPIQVPLPSGIVALAAGYQHALAVRADGSVWAWGSNSTGQLGNNSTTPTGTPVRVQGLSNVVEVAAGQSFSLALRSDGTVWAWGTNLNDELGSATGQRLTPIEVPGLTGVVAIAAGQAHGLALKSDGTVWAWGANGAGQVGNGTTTDLTSPTQVLTGAVAIAAGGSHSLALLFSGGVDAWGSDSNGQIGNGAAAASVTLPTPVSGLSGVVGIAAGLNYSLAAGADGTLRGWGQNNNGQLMVANTTDQHSPVLAASVNHGAEIVAAGSGANHTLVIGQPHVALSASTLSFTKPTAVGQSSISLPETVTNNGLAPLQIGPVALTANPTSTDGDEFSITADGCTGQPVAPGSSCTVGARFNLRFSGGNEQAVMRIPSNSPTSPDQATLDPPGRTRSRPDCLVVAHSAKRLTVRCTLVVGHRLTIVLRRGRHTLATARATTKHGAFTIVLRFEHHLTAGRYLLTLSDGRESHLVAAIKLRRI